MIAIIDYGMGNLRSVQKALEKVGAQTTITQNPQEIESAQKVVLPGVGAMQPAMERLQELNLIDVIQNIVTNGKTFLGICLGLQLLFDESDEGGSVKGLGIVSGRVQRFNQLKVPHMGWNQLDIKGTNCPLLSGIQNSADTYFCHSYFVQPKDKQIATTTTDYGIAFTSSIHSKNVFGVQFHPEKSQSVGLQILKNFVELPQ